jgi:hypothetical protein
MDKPTLVHSQDAENVSAKQAEKELEWATSRLAANLMRIVAGAGKPQKVFTDAYDFCEAYSHLLSFHGRVACDPLAAIVKGATDFEWRRHDTGYTQPTAEFLAMWERDGSMARERMIEEIARWSLRWRAAQLLAQPTQESQAHSGIYQAIRSLERLY